MFFTPKSEDKLLNMMWTKVQDDDNYEWVTCNGDQYYTPPTPTPISRWNPSRPQLSICVPHGSKSGSILSKSSSQRTISSTSAQPATPSIQLRDLFSFNVNDNKNKK